ncbi:GMC family oxidoreductase [Mesorhizobium sangaii]|uniref:Choline dehydrogenase n=1 Tax=Mesorhizobium sangaii TaxID=505389 RepID=A0A841PUC3_9HYPH|nr:GMC family oxidoreductase N-terminal domain-containing protein [Mesorhizobium sangaii]MBB6413759.1 choline dehydrogenase [Mesorhizobium sangaii]
MKNDAWHFETDYCVVGAGSAGCVVSARLAEDEQSKVLVLEAGPNDWHPFIHIPAGYFYLLSNPTFNWMYNTEPEEATCNRRITFPSGRGLGGGSSINGILFVRGQAAEYDRWEKLGCDGWNFSSMLPYFKKAETFLGDGTEYRGNDGPITVSAFRTVHPLARDFVEAARQAGHTKIEDINSPVHEGVSFFQQNRNGRFRANTASAYLRPAKKKNPNLRVETNATCSRIIFDGKRVKGVEFTKGGVARRVRVLKEVIVSSGAIRSPQLLQLSGIGDPVHLKSIGVPVTSESINVGRNLRDQYLVRLSHRVKGVLTINETKSFASIAVETIKYLTANRGLLTLGASMAAVRCKSSPEAEFADLQLMFAPVSFSPTLPGKLESAGGMTIGVWLSCPDSVGTVRARSSTASDRPIIHPNYLSAETDWPRLLFGLRAARKIFEMDALRRWSIGETTPGKEVVTDDNLYEYTRRAGSTAAHYAGTCQMGSDDRNVTDTQLRVRGVSGLRVVDNSVVPSPVSGGMNATAIAVAERAADLIKGC